MLKLLWNQLIVLISQNHQVEYTVEDGCKKFKIDQSLRNISAQCNPLSVGRGAMHIIKLNSILEEYERCNFCNLLFLALCLPVNDPLQESTQRDKVLKA